MIVDNLLSSNTMPLFTAFIIGLMTIISPCPFCSNLSAIGFISKDLSSRRGVLLNGVMYALGRIVTYSALALIFILGTQIAPIQHFFESYGEPALGPFLILCGLFMLIGGHHEEHHDHEHNHGLNAQLTMRKINVPSWLWSFVLGIVFSLAFCPYSGVMYFGILMPMTMAQPLAWNWLMPIVYGLGTGLPVIIVAWLLAYSVMSIGKINQNIKTFERWFRRACAILFIGIGVYLCISIFGGHHNHNHEHHEFPVQTIQSE